MEAGDIYTEPLRDDEEDGGRKRAAADAARSIRVSMPQQPMPEIP